MKFIYFSVLCFNLTCLNHSFAMEEGSSIRVASRQPFLDVPLNQTNGIHGTCKDLPPTDPKDYRYHDQRFYGRSRIYNLGYPRMSMIHSYHQEGAGPAGLSVPFSACLPFEAVSVPRSLKDKMPSHSSHPKRAFSFVVQAIEKGSGKARFYSLKPQYQMYPGAKMLMNPDEVQGQKFSGPLQWIVIPGAEGSVLPEKKDNEEGLLADSVSVHRSGGKPFPDYMILSGDVMHLTGIDSSKSVDAYDLVIFDDITAVTYRWLLADKDLETFNTALVRANTFGEIVRFLEEKQTFASRLNELKRFMGLSLEEENMLSPPNPRVAASFVPQAYSIEEMTVENIERGVFVSAPIKVPSRIWFYKALLEPAEVKKPNHQKQPWKVEEGQEITVTFNISNLQLKGQLFFSVIGESFNQLQAWPIYKDGPQSFKYTVRKNTIGLTPLILTSDSIFELRDLKITIL